MEKLASGTRVFEKRVSRAAGKDSSLGGCKGIMYWIRAIDKSCLCNVHTADL